MQRKFRTWKFGFCLFLILGASPFLGFDFLQAQDFPTKPINLVIPFAAGGASELQARAFTHHGPKHLGQPIVLVIRAGGSGAIGSEFVAQAKPDGYTLLYGFTGCNSVMPAIEGRSKGPDDLAPVIMVALSGGFFWVPASSPFKNLKDVIDWAKAHPGELTYGNTGPRSVTDFRWRWFEKAAGIKTRNVAFPKGAGEAMVALLGGHIMIAGLSTPTTLPQMRAGKVRPIASLDFERHPDLPDIPTMKEQGYDPGFGANWRGIVAPKKTPRPIIDKLYIGFKKMYEEPDSIANLKKMGDYFLPWGPEEFEKYWRNEMKVFKEFGKQFPH
jgi:tripartite-type tricarboxylate transporter receptor subunit TctC